MPNPTIRLTVKGNLGQISADSFVTVIDKSLIILQDLDRRISDIYRGTTHWVISGLGEGSANILLEAKQIRGKGNYPEKIADRFTTGMQFIQREGKTPPYFSQDDVIEVRRILQTFARNGAHGVNYSLNEGQVTADLSVENEPDVAKLVGESYKAIGSIEGKVELVSVRRRSRRFSITQVRTQRAVRCTLTDELEEDAIRALHERRRVIVTGVISYNTQGEPIKIHVKQKIRFLGDENTLPTIGDLAGRDKDFTGNLTSEEYFRGLSDG